MNHVKIAEIEGYGDAGNEFRSLSDSLGTDGLAVNHYECAPGETIGDCYHRHHEQEELFYVVSGIATFETEGGEARVETGEMIRFAPGEWQQGRNEGRESLVVLALGAPREQGPTDLRRVCEACGERTPATIQQVGDEWIYYCETCGSETGHAT